MQKGGVFYRISSEGDQMKDYDWYFSKAASLLTFDVRRGTRGLESEKNVKKLPCDV